MTPPIVVQTNKGSRINMSLSPTKILVNLSEELTSIQKQQVLSFVDYVVEQFVEITELWRGNILFEVEGVTWLKVVLKSGLKNRKYEVVV